MTTVDVDNYGPGTVFVGETLVFYSGDEFIEVRQIPAEDLRACADGRFVPPAGEWQVVAGKVTRHRVLVVVGEVGSGRRTAALHRLRGFCEMDQIHELEPVWSRPRDQVLPPVRRECGYLLDMSEPTAEPPRSDFGGQLLAWAQKQEIYLIVTTTPEVWRAGRWTSGAEDAVVRLTSPDARLLVEQELRAAGEAGRLEILSDAAFEPIWTSRPKAEDACRLAKIIVETPDPVPSQIADEYGNWRGWIDRHLPSGIGPRTLLWSCAFCDGGKRKSVLRMAEALRRDLGEQRMPAHVLTDDPASKRLAEANIERFGDTVRLAPAQHGLAPAVLRHLWDEYEDQTDVLKGWVVDQAATLAADDADRVVDAVLDLVIQYRDDDLLRTLRDKLTGERRPLAVRALSRAVLDPRFGAHVRGRLYTWLAHSPSQDLIDIVAEVCGGPFGEQKPTMALVRLRRAALKTRPGSPALANAFTNLATHHPQQVLDAIETWFTDSSSTRAGINAFIALASGARGAKLLSGNAAYRITDPDSRRGLIAYLQAALADPDSTEIMDSVLGAWAGFVNDGTLEKDVTIEVLGVALAPWLGNNIFQRFLPSSTQLDINSFWGRVLSAAIQASTHVPTGTDANVPEN